MAEYVYRPVVAATKAVFAALRLRIDVQGSENVPASGGAIIMFNHISHVDHTIGGLPFWNAARRPVRFMAKKSMFEPRISGAMMRGMHHIPVDRAAGAASLREALVAVRAGELVGVFPESTISPSFCLAPFKSGTTRMAVAAKVPVIPVALWGSQRISTKGHKPHLRTAFGVPITVVVGRPVPPEELTDSEVGNALLRKALAELLDGAQRNYPRPAPGKPDWWLPAHLGGSAPPAPSVD